MASQQLLGDSKTSIMDSQQPPEVSKTIHISFKSAQLASLQLLEIAVKQRMDSQ